MGYYDLEDKVNRVLKANEQADQKKPLGIGTSISNSIPDSQSSENYLRIETAFLGEFSGVIDYRINWSSEYVRMMEFFPNHQRIWEFPNGGEELSYLQSLAHLYQYLKGSGQFKGKNSAYDLSRVRIGLGDQVRKNTTMRGVVHSLYDDSTVNELMQGRSISIQTLFEGAYDKLKLHYVPAKKVRQK